MRRRSSLDARLDLHPSASVDSLAAGGATATGARLDARLDPHGSASVVALGAAAAGARRSSLDARLDLHRSASVEAVTAHGTAATTARLDARLDLHRSASLLRAAARTVARLDARLDLHGRSLRRGFVRPRDTPTFARSQGTNAETFSSSSRWTEGDTTRSPRPQPESLSRIPRRRFGRSSSRCRRSSTRNHRTSRCSRRQGASAVLRRGWWLGARRRSPHRRPGRDSPVGSSDSRWANRRMPRTHARWRARERAGSVGACRRREQRACRRSARDRAMTLRAPQGRAAALGSGPRAEVCPADALPCPVPAPISWRSRARVRPPACPHRGRREATDLRSGESAVMVRSPLRYAPGLVDRSRLDARLDLHGSASVRQAGVHVARGARPDARLDLHHSASIEGLAVAAGAGLEGRLDLHRLSLR